MTILRRTLFSMRTKLALLAGVPMIGALLLALFVTNDARERAASAASLGSIEDLARLTSYIADVLHSVQDERARSAMRAGQRAASPADSAAPLPAGTEAWSAPNGARLATDTAAARLQTFLSTRERAKLPARLSRGVVNTENALVALPELRARLDGQTISLSEVLAAYGAASSGLVSATAALAELTDDGAMLRNISAMVALLELEERSSIEHAIVGFAAARGEFPPGAFKSLVTTTTEENVYDQAFRTSASDEVRRTFVSAREKGMGARALLESTLTSTEDAVALKPMAWNDAQGAAMRELREVERVLLMSIESVAASKGAELKSAVRVSLGVALAVVVSSVLMAFFVRRGIQRSVHALTFAAEKVRTSRDFSVRARRVSDDELGMLTETFNEMLGGIQSRDAELEQHRSHLEGLVVARTHELAARNAAMRLVHDNVDQGLVTIDLDGVLRSERSAAFDRWFAASGDEPRTFYDAIGPDNERLRLSLKMAWEQLVLGFLRIAVSLDQIPARFDRGNRHFTLSVKPIVSGESVIAALLVISDVTAELDARNEQARQREEVQVFQRIASDKAGFVAFLEETGSMVEQLRSGHGLDAKEQLALVHTVKGNAAQCDVRSVADVAHELESFIVDANAPAGRSQLFALFRAWDALGLQVGELVGPGDSRIEITHGELERLVDSVKSGLSKAELVSRLEMFFDEPVATRFSRLGGHAQRLAGRLGKPSPKIEVDTCDLRLPRQRYAAFWAGLVHVVRNAVDHGVEDAAVRLASGKATQGKLSFRARVDDRAMVLEIADDGAGIDWARLQRKAEAAGLPSGSPDDLSRALFASGVTTLDVVTETSGRGVGLAAVWHETVKLGGTVVVTGEACKGTQFVFRVPLSRVSPMATKVQGVVS